MTARATICVLVLAAPLSLRCRREGARDGRAAAPPTVVTASGVEMVRLPGGWFEMGSAGGPAERRPVHRVWVDPFWIDRTEVTQEQFSRLSIPDPSHFKHPKRPVEQVTFAEAVEYCNERSEAEGLRRCYTLDAEAQAWTCDFDADGYRLPTEAEWEYACRAGTATERFFAEGGRRRFEQYAWQAANSSRRTQPVASKRPNPWGLYDMYGNVAEWCNDLYDPNYYRASPSLNPRGPARGKLAVLRGGAWDSPAIRCSSAARAGENPRFHDVCFARDTIGFRCARNAPKATRN